MSRSPDKELSLEEIIHLANKVGLEYVDKRREAERLELLRTTVRAQIMNSLEESQPECSEAKLKRLAEAHTDYVKILEEIADRRAESEKLRIRYDSYRNLFEARRSLLSYKKVEMKALL